MTIVKSERSNLFFVPSPEFPTARKSGKHREICKRLEYQEKWVFQHVDVCRDPKTFHLPIYRGKLSDEETQHYFRKMNYAFFVAYQLEKHSQEDRRVQLWKKRAQAIADFLVVVNYPLLLFFASNLVQEDFREEYISFGQIELVKAVRRFDYTRGYKFATFATKKLLGARTAMFREMHKTHCSLGSGSGNIVDNRMSDADKHEYQEFCDSISQAAIETLPTKQQNIVRRAYGLDGETETLQHIANEAGVTRSRISFIHVEAKERMRRYLKRTYSRDEYEYMKELWGGRCTRLLPSLS